jgi:hypothetical protein
MRSWAEVHEELSQKLASVIELSAFDKQQFRDAIASPSRKHSSNEDKSLDSLLRSFVEYQQSGMQDLVATRLPIVEQVLKMAQDPEWSLPRIDRKRIASTFRYLLSSAKLEISRVESSLLQAGAIDLMQTDCRAELLLYREYCELRQRASNDQSIKIRTRADWLRYKREMLQRTGQRRFFGMRRSLVSRRSST